MLTRGLLGGLALRLRLAKVRWPPESLRCSRRRSGPHHSGLTPTSRADRKFAPASMALFSAAPSNCALRRSAPLKLVLRRSACLRSALTIEVGGAKAGQCGLRHTMNRRGVPVATTHTTRRGTDFEHRTMCSRPPGRTPVPTAVEDTRQPTRRGHCARIVPARRTSRAGPRGRRAALRNDVYMRAKSRRWGASLDSMPASTRLSCAPSTSSARKPRCRKWTCESSERLSSIFSPDAGSAISAKPSKRRSTTMPNALVKRSTCSSRLGTVEGDVVDSGRDHRESSSDDGGLPGPSEARRSTGHGATRDTPAPPLRCL